MQNKPRIILMVITTVTVVVTFLAYHVASFAMTMNQGEADHVLVSKPLEFPENGLLFVYPKHPLYRIDKNISLAVLLKPKTDGQLVVGEPLEGVKLTDGQTVRVNVVATSEDDTHFVTKPMRCEQNELMMEFDPPMPEDARIRSIMIESPDMESLLRLVWRTF